ncbi:MAG TPA: HAD family hydrolase [Verrucomicrobiales bacterium]|nr:HAD family hydrolase [Verrucomicrobiae bacterium]MCP5555245.1 HAD family hydrolase [Akkermansiaceae bacterium]HRX55528.1 HAD family hydrolase [Verrucomicrobiales bacterium]
MNEAQLVARIREASRPMAPVPSGESPNLKPLPGVRAVVFDLYGTLFLSGAGAESGVTKESLQTSFAAVGLGPAPRGSDPAERYREVIHRHHAARRQEGVAYPEVDVREVWAEVLGEWGIAATREELEQLVVEVDCRCHPSWPAPGMPQLLATLRDLGWPLGILSNAQFHTPLLFPALTGRTVAEWGFQEELVSYSWTQREAKPSRRLFLQLADAFEDHHGILTHEVAFVGNDLRNDIAPALEVGFRAVLFAGDARSLRWRPDDASLTGVLPDRVVTDLGQLPALLLPISR